MRSEEIADDQAKDMFEVIVNQYWSWLEWVETIFFFVSWASVGGKVAGYELGSTANGTTGRRE